MINLDYPQTEVELKQQIGKIMTKNKYGGICRKCGRTILPGEGNLERRNKIWGIWHNDCLETLPGLKTSNDDTTDILNATIRNDLTENWATGGGYFCHPNRELLDDSRYYMPRGQK